MPTETGVSRQVGVRVLHDQYAALVKIATARKRSISFLLKEAVEQYLQREAKRTHSRD